VDVSGKDGNNLQEGIHLQTSAGLGLSVLQGPRAASRLASQLQSDTQLATLYDSLAKPNSPLLLLVRGDRAVCTDVVAVAVGKDENIVCALVMLRKTCGKPENLLVTVAQPNDEALSSLAQAVFGKPDAPMEVLGFEPHIGQFARLAPSPSHEPACPRRMVWLFSRMRMTWSPDDPHAMAAASQASLPAGATVGAPEGLADFEAMARIDAQKGLTNDPLMEKHGLEERVKEMAEAAAEGGVTIAREASGALVAMVTLSNETDETVFVKAVGTLPSHARRGYASALLAHVLLVKMKRAPLMIIGRDPVIGFPRGNEAAAACYAKLGFVHTAEFCGYKHADEE